MAAAATMSSAISRATGPILMPSDPLHSRSLQTMFERVAGPLLLAGILSLIWMILRARGILSGSFSEATEVACVIVLWSLLFVLVSAVGLMSARNHGR
jgi:hypothetical protein